MALAVAGCSTTQDEAARLQLNSARIRASELHTVVHTAGTRLRVEDVALVSGRHGGSAIVVQVHNAEAAAISDLPISVGVREPGHGQVGLNVHSSAELSYFNSHLPSVAGGDTLTWVFATSHTIAPGSHVYALIGDRPDPLPTRFGVGSPPRIDVRVVSRKLARNGRTRLMVSLRNTTSVPQYQLPVYAVARRGGRLVAAGVATVPHLGSHRTERFPLPVIGSLAHARLELTAAPTIFN